MKLFIELIGYLGSLLVVISMLMTSVKKLRVVNTIGSVIFTAYAFVIQSYPTAFMNLCLIVINVVNLVKLVKAEKTYGIIQCYKDESIVQLYLKQNLEDIKRYFPEFDPTSGGHAQTFLVFTGSLPIGIAIGNMKDSSTISIELDYTIPSYRDYSVGKFLYKYLSENFNVSKVIFEGKLAVNDAYLEKMSFKKIDSDFVKEI